MNSTTTKKIRTIASLSVPVLFVGATIRGLIFAFPGLTELIVRVGIPVVGVTLGLQHYVVASTKSSVCAHLSKTHSQVDWPAVSNSRSLRWVSIAQAVTLMLVYGVGLELAYVEQHGVLCVIITIILAIVQLPLFWRIYKTSILKQVAQEGN